jgi:hypothetical protein
MKLFMYSGPDAKVSCSIKLAATAASGVAVVHHQPPAL